MIYGNASVLNLINRAVNGRKLSHAYLFYGEKGLGKKAIAAYFAKAILCHGDHRPCNSCSSCIKFDALSHPDLTILSGYAEKNEMAIDSIRKLKAESAILPNDGDHKVYLIADCQEMSDLSANALLKLLEEPPEHLTLLLTVDDKSHVLPTVLSRCIPVGIFPVDEESYVRALMELGNADEATARQYASLCGGNIGKGLSMLSPDESALSPDAFCLLLAKKQEYQMLSFLSSIGSNRKKYRAFLEEVFECIRNAAVLKSNSSQAARSANASASALISGFTAKQLLNQIRILSQAIRDLDHNANVAILSTWLTGALLNTEPKL